MANRDNPSLSILMMLVTYFLFALEDTSVKWLLYAGLGSFHLAFMRYASHFVISLRTIAWGGVSLSRFATPHLGLVLFRGFLLVSVMALNFIVSRYLSLTAVSAIIFLAPIIVCLLSWPLLGERVGPWRWFAIFLGLSGVLFVIRPFVESFHWAALMTCYYAAALTLYSIITCHLSGLVAAETMQFYMEALGTFSLLPLAFLDWATPSSLFECLLMCVLRVWAWAGHGMLPRAHGLAPTDTLMPYTCSFMIFLTIEAYIVFAEFPYRWTLTGTSIVIVSGLIIWKRSKLKKETQ